MAHDQMSEVEREILNDPFLSETVDLNFSARSEAFQDAYRRKFGIAKPEPHPFDIALDNRINQDPKAVFAGKLTSMLRDRSVRAELVERDPKWKVKFQASLMEEEAERFRTLCPDYYVSEWNHEVMVDWMARNLLNRANLDVEDAQEQLWDSGQWSAENLRSAYLACLDKGGLQVKPGTMKKLSREEELEVVAIGQAHGAADAIARYLEIAIGALPDNINTSAGVARWRAQNPDVGNAATLWVFRQLRANGLTDENWAAFSSSVTARFPLLTYAMLESAFDEWGQGTRLFPNGRAAAQETREDLDELSDEEIAERLVQARRAAARARTGK